MGDPIASGSAVTNDDAHIQNTTKHVNSARWSRKGAYGDVIVTQIFPRMELSWNRWFAQQTGTLDV